MKKSSPSQQRSRPAAEEQLQTLRNLGRTSAQWLHAAGIRDERTLRELGAVQAFRNVRARGFRPSLVLLYAIEGALLDVHWNQLSIAHKTRLRELLEAAADDNMP